MKGIYELPLILGILFVLSCECEDLTPEVQELAELHINDIRYDLSQDSFGYNTGVILNPISSGLILVQIENSGINNASTFEVIVSSDTPESEDVVLPVQFLASGDSLDLYILPLPSVTGFNLPRLCLDEECFVQATVDYNNSVEELNEHNNDFSAVLTRPPSRPDLVVVDEIDFDVNCSLEGCVTTVMVPISNTGAVAVTGTFEVEVILDPEQEVVIRDTQPSLGAGTTVVFTFVSPLGGNCYDPDCTITIVIDPDDLIDEENEQNNRLQRTFEG